MTIFSESGREFNLFQVGIAQYARTRWDQEFSLTTARLLAPPNCIPGRWCHRHAPTSRTRQKPNPLVRETLASVLWRSQIPNIQREFQNNFNIRDKLHLRLVNVYQWVSIVILRPNVYKKSCNSTATFLYLEPFLLVLWRFWITGLSLKVRDNVRDYLGR